MWKLTIPINILVIFFGDFHAGSFNSMRKYINIKHLDSKAERVEIKHKDESSLEGSLCKEICATYQVDCPH